MEQTSEHRSNLGQWMDKAVQPLTSLGSSLRESRLLQNGGIFFHADVRPKKNLKPHLRKIANQLTGDALVRLSGSLWREEHRLLPDILSCSIRFRAWPPMEEPAEDSQDIILMSARNPLAIAIDSLRTNQHDYLLNSYYGASLFEVDGGKNVELRAVPRVEPGPGRDRDEKIRRAVMSSDVIFDLEICERERDQEWKPLLEIHLKQETDIHPEDVHFHPWRDGQTLRAQSLMEYLRPMPDIMDRLSLKSEQRSAQEAARQATGKAGRTLSETRATAEREMQESRSRISRMTADAADRLARTVQTASGRTAEMVNRAGETTASLIRRSVNKADNLATETGTLAASATEMAAQAGKQTATSTAETVTSTAETGKTAARRARNSSRKTARQAKASGTRAANQATDQAVSAANRSSEAVAQTANEAHQAADDIVRRAREGGTRVMDESESTARDIASRTREAGSRMKEE